MFRGTRSHRTARPALLGASLLLLASTQSGCQACWSIDGGSHCGSADWGCGSGAEFNNCGDGEAALIIGAVYLALAIPYVIAEACRSCN